MFWRITGLFLVLSFLTACESMGDEVTNFFGGEDNSNPPTPLKDYQQKLKINKLWDEDIGDGTDEKYLKLAPVFYEYRIYIANRDGDVKALDATNGKKIWNQETDSRVSGGPGAGNGLIVVGTSEAEVIALSSENGDILWTSRVSSEVLAAPVPDSNVVIIRSIDGKIFGLNADNGKRLWIYDRDVPTLSLRGTSSPVISGGIVIAGFDEGRLVAIELQTGKLIWETRIALGSGRSELDRVVDIDSDPVIFDNLIYVSTFQGRIAAITLDGGRIVWTRDIPSYAGITVDETAVYITDDDSIVWALDRLNGNSIWKMEDLQSRALTGPAKDGNMIVVGDLEGYLHWLDNSSGEIVGRINLSDSKIIANPLVVDNTVFSYASDGTLGAFTHSGNSEYKAPVATVENNKPVDTPEGEIVETEIQQSDGTVVTEETELQQTEDTAVTEVEGEKRSVFGRLLDIFTGGDSEPEDE